MDTWGNTLRNSFKQEKSFVVAGYGLVSKQFLVISNTVYVDHSVTFNRECLLCHKVLKSVV